MCSAPVSPHDVTVRLAWPPDAPGLAAVQKHEWRRRYAGLMPAEWAQELDAAPLETSWSQLLQRPRQATTRALAALVADQVSGCILTGESTDPDLEAGQCGELSDWLWLPGTPADLADQLLLAGAHTLLADGFALATMWIDTDADQARSTLIEHGFAADGAHRTLALTADESVLLKQIRLISDLSGLSQDSSS